MKILPTVLLNNFPEIVFNCSVFFDNMKAVDFWSGKTVAYDGKSMELELIHHTCALIEF